MTSPGQGHTPDFLDATSTPDRSAGADGTRTADACGCAGVGAAPRRRVVLTGGPGAGKTAALEVIRADFGRHVQVLPEAASIVYGGGFPRRATVVGRQAAQVAIFHIQSQLERWAEGDTAAALTVCDRGLLDGVAYWPGTAESFFAEVGHDRASLFARYDLVIHLRTPPAGDGYNHQNPLRTEDADEARRVDERIHAVWAEHPHRVTVANTHDFREKIDEVLGLLRAQLPATCCRLIEQGARS